MAQIISITITESSDQITSGIPKYVTLSTNIPSSIFYTFDNTTPTTSSKIYAGGQLSLPTNQTSVILKLFATDGTDTSAIITETYKPDISNIRKAYDKVTLNTSSTALPNFPYGDPVPDPPGVYDNTGLNIVNAPNVTNDPNTTAVDSQGNPAAFTDEPLANYDIKYSITNRIGERGNGIGTLPSNTTFVRPAPAPNSSNAWERTFNPKALIIYQDNTKEQFDPNISQINKRFFSRFNKETAKDAAYLTSLATEGNATTGHFVRSVYNPKDQTLTYYYYDNETTQWIISKEPYSPSTNVSRYCSIIFSSREAGSRFVYSWRPFSGRLI